MLKGVESILSDEDDVGGQMGLRKAIQTSEEHILSSSSELRDIIVESGSMAESLFERVDSGYHELEEEIKGLSNVEKVLLDTADAVMDTKRKIEFGVQQIIFKVRERCACYVSGQEFEEKLSLNVPLRSLSSSSFLEERWTTIWPPSSRPSRGPSSPTRRTP